MNEDLENLLENLLVAYPDAQAVAFESVEWPISLAKGEWKEVLEKYKDLPMMSLDESFNTSFSFIVTEEGTIIIFFIRNLHFVSVFVKGENPNKELAGRMYEGFRNEFEKLIDKL